MHIYWFLELMTDDSRLCFRQFGSLSSSSPSLTAVNHRHHHSGQLMYSFKHALQELEQLKQRTTDSYAIHSYRDGVSYNGNSCLPSIALCRCFLLCCVVLCSILFRLFCINLLYSVLFLLCSIVQCSCSITQCSCSIIQCSISIQLSTIILYSLLS